MLKHQDLNSHKHIHASLGAAWISFAWKWLVFSPLFQLEVIYHPFQKELSAQTMQITKWEK